MTRTEFWQIIDAAHQQSGGKLDPRYQVVRNQLLRLPLKEVVEFNRIMHELLDHTYRGDLWAAAYIINGGCSDDGFADFQGWLLSRGETAYEQCIADAENVGDWQEGEECIFFESFTGVAAQVYYDRTGRDIWEDFPRQETIPPRERLIGELLNVEPEALSKRLPKLFSNFWGKWR
jgi:hypothetical protein